MSEQQSDLTATQVEEYLRQHPEFFNEHLHLLEHMSIPHPSGNAISLISKQLEIFRSRHHEMENQLTALIEIARDNDTSLNRMHKLTLALLDATTLEEAVANLDIVLSEYFLIDFVAVRIIKHNRLTRRLPICLLNRTAKTWNRLPMNWPAISLNAVARL